MQSAARSVIPGERVAKCYRVPIASDVAVMKSEAPRLGNNYENVQPLPRFSYANLMACGSVWHCPVCAAKISEKRKVDVAKVLKANQDNGGENLLLTLTIPHHQGQGLKTILDVLTRAYGGLTKSRPYRQQFGTSKQLYGTIRALEVTHGKNGWHPHLHVILVTEKGVDLAAATEKLATEWRRQVERQGYATPNHHGLTIENGDKAARYVGKWGLEHEVTKGHTKQSRTGNTPFDLLRILTGSKTDPNVDVFEAATLFREYARVFKGRRQLTWSQGLRELFNLGKDKTDEELADQVDADATVFARIPLNVWRIVLKADKRGELLEHCHQGKDALLDYLTDLMDDAGELGAT